MPKPLAFRASLGKQRNATIGTKIGTYCDNISIWWYNHEECPVIQNMGRWSFHMDTLAPLGMERSEAMRASIDKPCHRSTMGFHGRISASNRKTPGKSEFCDLDPASRGRRLQSRSRRTPFASPRDSLYGQGWLAHEGYFRGSTRQLLEKPSNLHSFLTNFWWKVPCFLEMNFSFVKGRMYGIHNPFGVEKRWV